MDAERDGAIPLAELAQIAKHVQDSVDRIARSLSGRDHPGRPPEELRRLSRLEAVSIQGGSAVLEIEAPGDTEAFPIHFEAADAGVQAIDMFVAAVDAIARNVDLPHGVSGNAAESVLSFVRSLGGHENVNLRAESRGSTREVSIDPHSVIERSGNRGDQAGVSSTVVGRLYGVNLDTHTYRVRDELGRSHLITAVDEIDVRGTAQALLGETVRVTGEMREVDGRERIEATGIQRVASVGSSDYASWSLDHALSQVSPVASVVDMAIEDIEDNEFRVFWQAANSSS